MSNSTPLPRTAKSILVDKELQTRSACMARTASPALVRLFLEVLRRLTGILPAAAYCDASQTNVGCYSSLFEILGLQASGLLLLLFGCRTYRASDCRTVALQSRGQKRSYTRHSTRSVRTCTVARLPYLTSTSSPSKQTALDDLSCLDCPPRLRLSLSLCAR